MPVVLKGMVLSDYGEGLGVNSQGFWEHNRCHRSNSRIWSLTKISGLLTYKGHQGLWVTSYRLLELICYIPIPHHTRVKGAQKYFLPAVPWHELRTVVRNQLRLRAQLF